MTSASSCQSAVARATRRSLDPYERASVRLGRGVFPPPRLGASSLYPAGRSSTSRIESETHRDKMDKFRQKYALHVPSGPADINGVSSRVGIRDEGHSACTRARVPPPHHDFRGSFIIPASPVALHSRSKPKRIGNERSPLSIWTRSETAILAAKIRETTSRSRQREFRASDSIGENIPPRFSALSMCRTVCRTDDTLTFPTRPSNFSCRPSRKKLDTDIQTAYTTS